MILQIALIAATNARGANCFDIFGSGAQVKALEALTAEETPQRLQALWPILLLPRLAAAR